MNAHSRDHTSTTIPRWQGALLYGVGAWTALGGILALADVRGHAETFFGSADALGRSGDATLVVFRIAYAQLVAWGIGYAFAAWRPSMRVPVLIAGAIGKSFYFVLTAMAFAHGTGTAALLATGIGDLAIAVLFAYVVAGRRALPVPSGDSDLAAGARSA